MRQSKRVLSVVFCFSLVTICHAGSFRLRPVSETNRDLSTLWTPHTSVASKAADVHWKIRPESFRAFTLDLDLARQALSSAPVENSAAAARSGGAEFLIPTPDGHVELFRIQESPVMAPELAAKFPEIKTYIAQGIDNPAASGRLDMTPDGFHAFILTPDGAQFVDPVDPQDATFYLAYRATDVRDRTGFVCDVSDSRALPSIDANGGANRVAIGPTLRSYRLALACTGEYSDVVAEPNDPSIQRSLSAMVTTLNRVDGIYERELAIRMVMVANNDQIIYLDGNTDPYNNNSAGQMLDQNQTNLDQRIGSGSYDIGHVFSTRGGGLAFVGAVCDNDSKAGGVTGISLPFGDPFDVDYVAHEMGHQFGGNHPFNGTDGACSGNNRHSSTAYEVGSGSTIMAYAGICGSQNLQLNSDPYFHGVNYDEIVAYTSTRGGSICAQQSATGNHAPSVDAGPSYKIPSRTPFALTATNASDADNDTLTFCWEEFDLGPANSGTEDNKQSPIFRSFLPNSSPTRTFPKLGDVLANTQSYGELLPQGTRTMTFRVTVRDNRAGGGGVSFDTTTIKSVKKAGPFRVSAPNSSTTVSGGSSVTVQWDVAKTDKKPIKTKNVRILLSTDGGQTFTTVLSESTKNDGSESVTLPNVQTSAARIKVEAVGNIFFDISDTNFTIN